VGRRCMDTLRESRGPSRVSCPGASLRKRHYLSFPELSLCSPAQPRAERIHSAPSSSLPQTSLTSELGPITTRFRLTQSGASNRRVKGQGSQPYLTTLASYPHGFLLSLVAQTLRWIFSPREAAVHYEHALRNLYIGRSSKARQAQESESTRFTSYTHPYCTFTYPHLPEAIGLDLHLSLS
jgi:hypothetical protein